MTYNNNSQTYLNKKTEFISKPSKLLHQIDESNSLSMHDNIKNISFDEKNSWLSYGIKNPEVINPNNKKIMIHSFCTKTSKGLVRNYNEDKVAIIVDMNPGESSEIVNSNIDDEKSFKEYFSTSSVKSLKSTPKKQSLKINNEGIKNSFCSYFGLYDGHSGNTCADFLRDNLHHYILDNKNFITDKEKALYEAIQRSEKIFMNKSYDKLQNLVQDESGSCLISLLIDLNPDLMNKMLYIANVGDSRAIMSLHKGLYNKELSNDHKPSCANENLRIYNSGGKTFKSETLVTKKVLNEDGKEVVVNKVKYGVERIFPGGLSLSRAIGDISAKIESLGGNPDCLIATPEIKKVILKGDEDFLVVGCDGVWDVLDNEQVINCVFEALSQKASEARNIQKNYIEQNKPKSLKKKSIRDLFTPTKTVEKFDSDSDSSET